MELGSVIKVNPEQARRDYPYEEIEYIDISSVGTGMLHETKQIEFANAPSRAKRIIRNGDTLLATVRPNLRAFWFAQNIKENTIVSTGFAVLRANEEADPRFIYYTVTNQLFTDYLTANAKGAAYPAVDTETIERADVYLPPLPIQRKIATILSAYDDLIENNLRRIKTLEEMAQNLYREWFVNFRFPGHEHTRFVDSPLGRIPEGWEVKSLDDLLIFKNDGTTAGEHLRNLAYLPIDCIPRKSLAITEVKAWEEAKSSLHLFDEGDILFGAMRPYFHKVVQAPFKGVTRKTCFVFMSRRAEYRAYSLFTIFQEDTVAYASQHSKGATIPYAVWQNSMAKMKVIIPPLKYAQMFEALVSPAILRIGLFYKHNKNLRVTRDLLLPKLISGEVDVSGIDINFLEEEAV